MTPTTLTTPKLTELKKLLEEFGQIYQDYLAESDVYDGASLWSNERAKEILSYLHSLPEYAPIKEEHDSR